VTQIRSEGFLIGWPCIDANAHELQLDAQFRDGFQHSGSPPLILGEEYPCPLEQIQRGLLLKYSQQTGGGTSSGRVVEWVVFGWKRSDQERCKRRATSLASMRLFTWSL
jgi:hypothetical protein